MDIEALREMQKDNVKNSPFMAFKREGHNIVECAQRFGITCRVASHMAKMAGEPFDPVESERAREKARTRRRIRPKGISPRKRSAKEIERAANAAVTRERIAKMREEIKRFRLETPMRTSKEMADHLGISPKTAAQYAREAGLAFPKNGLGRPGDPGPKNAPFRQKHAVRHPALDAFYEKKRILRSMSNDANRSRVPVTLPYVSILDGVTD